MAKKLAIFDLDGTILDTLQDLADAVNHALEQNGLPKRTLAEVRAFIGNGIHNLIERSVPEHTPEDVVENVFREFKAFYSIHCAEKTCPYAGILDMLANIRDAGMKTAVLSNKADFAVQELVAKYFPGSIDYAAGEKNGVPKKPAPDSVYILLKEMDCTAEEAVYIGDSEVDIQTANNAGLDYIIVDWGFRDHDALAEAGAKVLLSTVEALEKMLLS